MRNLLYGGIRVLYLGIGRKDSHAKTQRRKENPFERRQRFAPLRLLRLSVGFSFMLLVPFCG